eukprot:s887_g17.t1
MALRALLLLALLSLLDAHDAPATPSLRGRSGDGHRKVNASEVPNSTATNISKISNISNISNVSNVSKVRKFRPMECCGVGCMCRNPKTWMCEFCHGADYLTCCTNYDDDWMKPMEFPKPPVIPEIPTFPPVELPKPWTPCHYPPC